MAEKVLWLWNNRISALNFNVSSPINYHNKLNAKCIWGLQRSNRQSEEGNFCNFQSFNNKRGLNQYPLQGKVECLSAFNGNRTLLHLVGRHLSVYPATGLKLGKNKRKMVSIITSPQFLGMREGLSVHKEKAMGLRWLFVSGINFYLGQAPVAT